MLIKKILDARQQRQLENLIAENAELKSQLDAQTEAILELADLLTEVDHDN